MTEKSQEEQEQTTTTEEAQESVEEQQDVKSSPANENGTEPEAIEEPQEDQLEKIKETTEKLWGSTVSAFSTATFKANQYKKLVQKKIDLSALHKKIGATHSDLGKLIDDLRESGQKSIMSTSAVKDLLTGLDQLKAEAASLEEEIEKVRTEDPTETE